MCISTTIMQMQFHRLAMDRRLVQLCVYCIRSPCPCVHGGSIILSLRLGNLTAVCVYYLMSVDFTEQGKAKKIVNVSGSYNKFEEDLVHFA